MKKTIATLLMAVPLTFAAQTAPAPAAQPTTPTQTAPVAKAKKVKKNKKAKKTAHVVRHKAVVKG